MRLAFFAFCIPFCIQLTATLIPQPNLAKRVESADAIVVAKLVHGTTSVSGSHVSNDLVLHIDRVLKGGLIPGADVAAHLEGRGLWVANVPTQTAIAPVYGLWFLNSTSSPYTLIPRSESLGELSLAVVTLPEDSPSAEPGSTPEISVANELASALRSQAKHGLQNEFRALAENFRTLNAATTLPLYSQFAREQSSDLRELGIQGIIAANDPEGVKFAAADPTKLAATSPLVAQNLMSYSNVDPSGVRALGELAMREPDPSEQALHQSAVYALRAIHTKETLPALAALLDSKDQEIQSRALSGFCLFVRNAPPVTPESVPSMSWLQTRQPAPFLNPETQRYCHQGGTVYQSGDVAQYVSFWKSWWTTHRTELEQP
jgi:hypothetical protein